MEVDSKGGSDSELSDAWSVVDMNLDELQNFIGSSDSGIATTSNDTIGTDQSNAGEENFELTAINLPDSNVSVVENQSDLPSSSVSDVSHRRFLYKLRAESDYDTDDISIIGDDEEQVADWKTVAHAQYQNTTVLETTPEIMSNDIGGESILKNKAEEIPEVEVPKESDERVEVFEETNHIWTNYIGGHFLTGALIAALTCIALGHFFRTNPTKDKIADMLEVVEKLKTENDVLRFQIQDLSTAFLNLESRLPNTPLSGAREETRQSHHKSNTQNEVVIPDTKNIIQSLQNFAASVSNPLLSEQSARLTELFSVLSNDSPDINNFNEKLHENVQAICQGSKDLSGLESSIRELKYLVEARFQNYKKDKTRIEEKKVKGIDLNIVQWYSSDDDVIVEIEESVENLSQKPSRTVLRDEKLPERGPILFGEPQTIVIPEEKDAKKLDVLVETPTESHVQSKKQKKKRKKKKKKIQENLKENVKFEEDNLTINENIAKKAKLYSNEESDKSCNGTNQWMFEKGKKRHFRTDGGWQFDRAKVRLDARKPVKDRSQWYFKRYDLHSPSKRSWHDNQFTMFA